MSIGLGTDADRRRSRSQIPTMLVGPSLPISQKRAEGPKATLNDRAMRTGGPRSLASRSTYSILFRGEVNSVPRAQEGRSSAVFANIDPFR